MGVPTYDIEAIEWVNPVAVGFYDGYTYHEFLKVSDDHDVIWSFLEFLEQNKPGIKLWAHNAANYDSKFILDSLHRHGQRVRFDGGLTKIVWVEAGITFEDSYILMCRSLHKLCLALDVERKLEWDHNMTSNPWEMVHRLDSFRAYLQRDVMALSHVIEGFCGELLDNFGITPSSTMSLTAAKAFDKGFHPIKSIVANDDQEKYIRQATYGGRNEVYKRYGENVHLYDIRSMYTSCYDTAVPVGKLCWDRINIDTGTLAEAFVKVPTHFTVGPLPFRLHGRLIFPVGEFKGWWDLKELRYAISLGCDVSIKRQLTADEAPVLAEFGAKVSELRTSANFEMSKVWKLMGLRLCGKFGQHRTSTVIKHVKDIKDFTGFYPIDSNEIYHEAVVHLDGRKSPYIRAAINMRIRSEARMRHLNLMLQASQFGDVFYCDNDSIFTNVEMPTSEEQGSLQELDFAQRLYLIRCKMYGYVDVLDKLRQKTAGFSDEKLTEADFQKVIDGGELTIQSRTIGDWKNILAGHGVQLIQTPRKVCGPESIDNRVFEGTGTRPIILGKRGSNYDASQDV